MKEFLKKKQNGQIFQKDKLGNIGKFARSVWNSEKLDNTMYFVTDIWLYNKRNLQLMDNFEILSVKQADRKSC